MPRRTWLDSKIDVFLEELAASGMHLGTAVTGTARLWWPVPDTSPGLYPR